MAKIWKRRPEVLLCPNTPKPLHEVCPRNILGSGWWNKERQAAYTSTNLRCLACGVHKTKAKFRKWLEGHELYDIDYQSGRMTYVETVPLCHACHNYIHSGRMESLLELGQLAHYKYNAVHQHGDMVLAMAGLFKPSHLQRELAFDRMVEEGKVAQWADWRLILFGKEYPPKFQTEKEYNEYWAQRNVSNDD